MQSQKKTMLEPPSKVVTISPGAPAAIHPFGTSRLRARLTTSTVTMTPMLNTTHLICRFYSASLLRA